MEWAIIFIIISNLLLCLVNIHLVKHYIKIEIRQYYSAIVIVALVSAASLVVSYYIRESFIPDGYIHIITNTVISITVVGLLYFLFCFDKGQRKYAISFFKTKLHLK